MATGRWFDEKPSFHAFGSGEAEMDGQADLQLDTLPEPIYMSSKLLNQVTEFVCNLM